MLYNVGYDKLSKLHFATTSLIALTFTAVMPYPHNLPSFQFLTTATGPHIMNSAPDLDSESGQGAQAASCVGAFFSLYHRCPLGQKC